MKKIRKTKKFFISPNMRIINSHPSKKRNFGSQEDLKIGNFLPFKLQELVLESPRNFQFLGFRKNSK